MLYTTVVNMSIFLTIIISIRLKENEGDFESTVTEELTPITIVKGACAYYKSDSVTTVDKVRSASKVSH